MTTEEAQPRSPAEKSESGESGWLANSARTVRDRLQNRGDGGWGEVWTFYWTVAGLFAGTVALAAVAGGGGGEAGDNNGSEAPAEESPSPSGSPNECTQTVEPGDTIGGLAIECFGQGPLTQDAIDKAVAENDGSTIYPGEVITLELDP